MPEFNFDFIFTGTTEEQRHKSAHFIKGISSLLWVKEQHFATEIVNNYGEHADEYGKLEAIERCYEAFAKDQRSHDLAKACIELDKQESAKDFRSAIEEALEKVFGPGAVKAAVKDA